MPATRPAGERFWAKVDPVIGPHGCWLWIGAISDTGYGHLHVDGKHRSAHRFSFEMFRRMVVPAGLHLDHLCRVRHCVNPYHLEPVTNRTNARRGLRWTGTCCNRGHEWNAENTYIRPDDGGRQCRACERERYDPVKRHQKHVKRLLIDCGVLPRGKRVLGRKP